jgi:CheY-like chemotaxis protein
MAKILIIDDNLSVREMMSTVLTKKGYEVLQAGNGADGVQLALSQLPQLIISDVNMSHGDGYAILALLRNDPATASIPFILMTGHANETGMKRGIQEGASDYLAKPFTMQELVATVENRLKASGQA